MHALGLHRDGPTIKAALLQRSKKGIEIELLRSIHQKPDGPNVKPLYILAPILEGKKHNVVTALESWEVLIRELTLKLNTKAKVLAALPFQIEQLLPYSQEEALLHPFLQKKDKETTSVSLFSTTHTHLKQHLERFKEMDVDPDRVSSTSSALKRWAEFLFPKERSFFLCHVGMNKCSCIAIKDKKIHASLTLNFGLEHFIEALGKDLSFKTKEELMEDAKEISLTDLDKDTFANLYAFKEQFQRELDRIFYFLKSKAETDDSTGTLFSGCLTLHFQLKDFLDTCLESTKLSLFHLNNFDFSTLQAYAIPIGLALEDLSQDKCSLQLRQGAYLHKAVVKSRKRNLITYLGACLGLSIFMGVFGHLVLQKREAILYGQVKAHRELKSAADKPLVEQLVDWEKSLSKEKKVFPYIPNVPKASDVLSYLSTHPLLTAKADNIDIKRVHYSLVKYPKAGESVDPYQAKVEIEFSTPIPTIAREFREYLLAGDSLVNAKNKIDWTVHQDTYRVSFFLNAKN